MAFTYDVRNAAFYSATKTPAENLQKVLDFEASLNLDTADDTILTKIQDYKSQLSIMQSQYTDKSKTFYEARDADLANVEALLKSSLSERRILWDTAEANDFGSGPAPVIGVTYE